MQVSCTVIECTTRQPFMKKTLKKDEYITVLFVVSWLTVCRVNWNLALYLCSSLNVWMTEETVNGLKLGWTLCPASLSVNSRLITWSTNVAQVSSDSCALLCPHPSLPCPISHSSSPSHSHNPWTSSFHCCVHCCKNVLTCGLFMVLTSWSVSQQLCN